MARQFLMLAAVVIPLALVPAHSWAQVESVLDQVRHSRLPPNWDSKFDQRPLSIPLTAQERQLIVAAMERAAGDQYVGVLQGHARQDRPERAADAWRLCLH